MPQQARPVLAMPPIGRPESYYAREVQLADKIGDLHAREANKVGQYVTLALDHALTWPQKLKYFQHALRRHCTPPPIPDDEVWVFYRQLADLVRNYCGEEALRLASVQDDLYADRQRKGESRDRIADDAGTFFGIIMGQNSQHPEHFSDDDWQQLKIIRDQWV